jgi:hypothetical protein
VNNFREQIIKDFDTLEIKFSEEIKDKGDYTGYH